MNDPSFFQPIPLAVWNLHSVQMKDDHDVAEAIEVFEPSGIRVEYLDGAFRLQGRHGLPGNTHVFAERRRGSTDRMIPHGSHNYDPTMLDVVPVAMDDRRGVE
jgi:hypothetical protein